MNGKRVSVVLAHGAWADASSWSAVVESLLIDHINAVTASLPLTSLPDDVAALDEVLAKIEGPVILVGHAYAGAVIASTRSSKVKALVFIAGLAPAAGETVAEVFNRFGHDDKAPALAPSSDGRIWLPPDAFRTAFAQHATAEQQAALAAAQRPICPESITVPVGEPLWTHLPSWFLVAQHDHMIPEKTQRFMAERMKAHVSVYPVDHLPSVTAPALVSQVILDAVHASS
ncbi:alpha/beta fold hydrolase [Dyella sp. C9]|uniref:alpha/beta fold hydrolase n=1 Tax=Dyella sp. C9 TaxID=2202154 RepID=UPI000DF005C0|nr:alpha/beta hydrolase [Dyella sp. C9]